MMLPSWMAALSTEMGIRMREAGEDEHQGGHGGRSARFYGWVVKRER